MSEKTISVVGLGKLGAPIAACFAAQGFSVIGVDYDQDKVSALRDGSAPVFEPGLQELLDAGKTNISASDDLASAAEMSDLVFLVVPTPSEEDGKFSLRYVLEACKHIGPVLSRSKRRPVIVVTSTVMPGSTGGRVRRSLEELSGKICGKDFGLCYSPAFIALGQVISNFLNPDFVLIGESDTQSGSLLEAAYRRLCKNDPPIRRMNFINAELVKLSLNSYVTTKITFANTLAQLCQRLPGADVDVVTGALGLDQRIGSRYLKGAVSFGGPCFPRDNRALAAAASAVDLRARLAEATETANTEYTEALATFLRSKLPEGGVAGVLGLSYKPDTDVVEESVGIHLACSLASAQLPVVVYDPLALPVARSVLGSSVEYARSLPEVLSRVDIVIIATPWDEFLSVGELLKEQSKRPRIIVDCWRMLERTVLPDEVELIQLGIGPCGGALDPLG